MKNKTKVWLIAAILAALAIAATVKLSTHGRSYPDYQNTTIAKDALDAYIERLAIFECDGCAPDFKRIDSNGKWSHSCLQFQKETFIWTVKKYNLLPNAEAAEIENLLSDCEFQKIAARQMFLNDPNAWRHWQTSIVRRGLGKPPI